MAKLEKITDDLTGKVIGYPYVSARSIRVELSPTQYVWIGSGDVVAFENGENLGKWVDEKMQKIVDQAEENSY